ncbi:MAG TPA: glycoside hydrolase family 9 protein [Chitinophagaceae bacterium]|nr:glycoside hydrolase family 9 protein [Chitinophagaceae bacterium]
MKKWLVIFLLPVLSFVKKGEPQSWIRINQLGYTPDGVKVAVWCSKDSAIIKTFQLVDAGTKKFVLAGNAGKAFGSYGPFKQTCRLNFSAFKKPGRYYLQAGGARSPEFEIADDVYKGTADFCLRYMRQQRSGFNPYLKDSCHTHDGYTLYGENAGIPDSTYIDVSGGWHDASDYLQYSSTSANATYHLLAAYRDFPNVFTDEKQANGLDGKNGMADVLDEAKWGLDWLVKMNPSRTIMFNQVGDDRDHQGMRIPKEDSFYGRGYERPVYFVSGEPQQRGKYMNATTGTSSTAAKFASVFALAHYLHETDSIFRKNDNRKEYYEKALDAYNYGLKKTGVTQTASVRSPYIYAEDNWTDDMELAAAAIHDMVINAPMGADNGSYMMQSLNYAKQEKITAWLGADTAKHYQWYPFINIGHYELIKQLQTKKHGPVTGYYKSFIDNFWNNSDTVINYYKDGIQKVWNKAKQNAFYRGVPFIWCSNNLTVAFAIQCYWYKQLSGDKTFDELEQANFDWLFGCNPWGTSMVYGLPSWGDTPVDPHSAFTHLKNYPIDGGLVDGPVYGSIFKGLIGIQLKDTDEYANFQSDLAVYHDDYGDYSSNEPTMDGTASLIYLLAAKEKEASPKSPHKEGTYEESLKKNFSYSHGGIIRGDSTQKKIALVFTGHEFAEGGNFITSTLQKEKIKASFFFTGDFYRNDDFKKLIQELKQNGNYLGPHSDKHLLYCDWNKRDSLLLNKKEFSFDLADNYTAMARQGIIGKKASFFLPPFEWYNDSIVTWSKELKLQLINYTAGTLSHADYTTDRDKNYRSSQTIYNSILDHERSKPAGLNGFILLMHIGAGPKRTDKFYTRLPELIKYLKAKGYQFQTVEQLLKE